MSDVVTVKLSPNRLTSCMWNVERRRTDLETDFSESLSTLKEKQKDTLRVIIVYCRTLMICADVSVMKWEKVSTTLLVHLN